MAQTLKYVGELLSQFPDNVSGLIQPEDVRDFVVSVIDGTGTLVDETEINIPILDGVWTSINPLLLSPESTANSLWVFDANNFAVNNYTALPTTVIPSGYSKLLRVVAVLDLFKAGGGADNYQMQVTKNGVGIGLAETVQFEASGGQTVTLLDSSITDVSVSDVYGIQVQGVGSTDDLTLIYFTQQMSDSILLAAPLP